MPRRKPMPDLSNATPGFLTDEIGTLRDEMKELKKREGFFKEALGAMVDGEDVVTGDKYRMVITHKYQMRLNTDGLKEEYGQKWYNEHSREIDFREFRTNKIET